MRKKSDGLRPEMGLFSITYRERIKPGVKRIEVPVGDYFPFTLRSFQVMRKRLPPIGTLLLNYIGKKPKRRGNIFFCEGHLFFTNDIRTFFVQPYQANLHFKLGEELLVVVENTHPTRTYGLRFVIIGERETLPSVGRRLQCRYEKTLRRQRK